ncbi:MAG: hypothetical protein ABH819_00845 [Patescibacteria group bacterium]|nr:hypothetical protein [Patescibacteria group bacterium]
MTERPSVGIIEKIKVCIKSLRVKSDDNETNTGMSDKKAITDPEDVEFLERELGFFPKSGSEGRATRGPHGSS